MLGDFIILVQSPLKASIHLRKLVQLFFLPLSCDLGDLSNQLIMIGIDRVNISQVAFRENFGQPLFLIKFLRLLGFLD